MSNASPSFFRWESWSDLPSPITNILCWPLGPDENVKSYAGDTFHSPDASIKKAKFFEWSFWLWASTLKTAMRNIFSVSRTSRVKYLVSFRIDTEKNLGHSITILVLMSAAAMALGAALGDKIPLRHKQRLSKAVQELCSSSMIMTQLATSHFGRAGLGYFSIRF